jgi:hypothetical protein
MKNLYIKFVRIIILVILLTSFTGLFAQRKAPGYMGKRFVLLYDQGFSWSFGKSIRGIPNFFYTLQGDFAISKKHSLGAEYSFRTRYYGSDYNKYSLGSNFQLERQMVHKIGIYTKMFSQRNGHIAPAGPYFVVGGHFHVIQSNFRAKPEGHSSYSIRDKGVTFDIAPFMGGGKQYIVANRIVLDVSMRISLPLINIIRNVGFNTGSFFGNNMGDEVIYNRGKAIRATQPNFEANILELRIGFGGVM